MSSESPVAIEYVLHQYSGFDAYVADIGDDIVYQFFPVGDRYTEPDPVFGDLLEKAFKSKCTQCNPPLSAEAQYDDRDYVKVAGMLRPDDEEGSRESASTFWVRIRNGLTYPMADKILKDDLLTSLDQSLRVAA